MFILYTFTHSKSTVALLAQRHIGLTPGEPFDDFFHSMDFVKSFPSEWDFSDVLTDVMRLPDPTQLVVIANPDIVTDAGLRERVNNSVALLEGHKPWSVAASHGLEWSGGVHSAIYSSATPSINYTRGAKPIIDAGLDLFIVNVGHLESMSAEAKAFPLPNFVQAAIISGYLEQRVSLFVPGLVAGINGSELGRDPASHSETISSLLNPNLMPVRIPSLSGEISVELPPAADGEHRGRLVPGPLDLESSYKQTVLANCEPTSLSIVTRTQFDRPHLLARLLASVSRARIEEVPTEVILSTDVQPDVAERELATLQREFPHLSLRLHANPKRGHSRVENMLGGIGAARNEYVAIVDDDDFLDVEAFDVLRIATFGGDRPLVVTHTRLARERWQETSTGWILAETEFHHEYPAAGWRAMFSGVNQLPICALLMPREWLQSRVDSFTFQNDLSEDYTLFLLLLSSPDLPLLRETTQVFTHVSVRHDGSNTITMEDRRQWVQDITLSLNDLFRRSGLVAEGATQVLTRDDRQGEPFRTTDYEAAVEESRRYAREVTVLKREIRHLRALAESFATRPREEALPASYSLGHGVGSTAHAQALQAELARVHALYGTVVASRSWRWTRFFRKRPRPGTGAPSPVATPKESSGEAVTPRPKGSGTARQAVPTKHAFSLGTKRGAFADRTPLRSARDVPPTDPLARSRVAVVAHVYYPELWGDLTAQLANLDEPYDLFVSLVQGRSDHLVERIRQDFASAVIQVHANRGRDIAPFMSLVSSGKLSGYPALLKLHTKRSRHRGDGDEWRKALWHGLLPSRERTRIFIERIANDPGVGCIVPRGNIVGQTSIGANWDRIEELLARAGVTARAHEVEFAAGSMYWLDGEIVELLASLEIDPVDDFEPEEGQIDGTTAHAVERIVGFLVKGHGQRIVNAEDLDKEVPTTPAL